jgi:hypothetical protein
MMERYKMKPTANIGLDDELILFDDGTIRYITHNVWNGDEIVYEDCEMYAVGNKGGMRIKYGSGSSFSFKDYATGEVDKRLTKIE